MSEPAGILHPKQSLFSTELEGFDSRADGYQCDFRRSQPGERSRHAHQ